MVPVEAPRKWKILLVDDEPQMLGVLRGRLVVRRRDWLVDTASSGQEAITKLKARRFDAVVTDMQMPGIDGVALLKKVRRGQPDAMRVILSYQTDHAEKLGALPVAHQLLDKPVSVDVLERAITRALTLRDRLGGRVPRGQVGQLDQMPTVPRLYYELSEALNDPDIALTTIGGIIEKDIVMTARVLQVVNSAYFALARPVSTINAAVSYLGTEALRTLVLSAALIEAFEDGALPEGFSIDDLHSHSIKTGLLAKRLVTDLAQSSLAYAAGVLHKVGMLVLATRLPSEYVACRKLAAEEGMTLSEAERELMGITHADIGAFLLGMWGLPPAIVDAVGGHLEAQSGAELDAPAAVHVANALITEQEEADGAPASVVAYADPEAKATAGLDMQFLERIGKIDQLSRWRGWAIEMCESAGA